MSSTANKPGTIPELSVQERVATITLQRSEQANRLGPDDLAAIYDHIETVNAMPEVLVLKLKSSGKYFCSGYDISRIGAGRAVSFESTVDALEAARPVTIALVHGGVYGGATDMALACDFRIGTPATNMFMPAARLGLHYYVSGMERYVARLGINAALRLFLTAERIDAAEMFRIGYLTHLGTADELTATDEQLTAMIAGMAPLPLLAMKKHLNRIARGTVDMADLQRDIAATAASADLQEGRAAWLEKRAPNFVGR